MYEDVVSEMAFGKGAVKVVGKLVMCARTPCHVKGVKLERTMIGGVVVADLMSPMPKKCSEEDAMDLSLEMWEVEMIIIPRRKFRGTKEGHEEYTGYQIDQILCSDWGNRERYKQQIFSCEDDANETLETVAGSDDDGYRKEFG